MNHPVERGATRSGFCALIRLMDAGRHNLPNDIEALKAALVAERDRRIIAEAEAAVAKADAAVAKARVSDDHALIVHLKLQIEKLKRELY